MALYKALMEETPLSRTKEPDSAIDDSTEVLSNSEGISSLITRKYFDPVTDNNDSEASTNVSELPYTVLNSSRDHENTTCGKSSSSLTDHNIFSEIPSSSAPENILTEITTELVCDTRLTETSFRQQPSSEESPSLTGVRRDTLGDHGDSSTQAIGDDGGINVDRYQPGPRVTVHNLDQSVSCVNCQIHHTDSDIDNRGEQFMYSDADKLYCKSLTQNKNTPAYKYSNRKTDEITDRPFRDQPTKINACSKDNICNKMSPNNERSIDQAITDEGQTRGHCLYLSNEALNTDKCNQLSDHVTTDFVQMITKNGHKYGDDFSRINPKADRKDRCQALNEQDKTKNNSRFHDTADLNIQNMDASQTDTLLIKIVPDPTVNTEANPVLAEALARRDEMVKDLSVDGSGLKVMCCLLGVIVVFAIAIITIVVTGL